MLIIGSVENSSWIKQLMQAGKIPAADLKGKREKYILQTVKQPVEGVEEAIVIAGSDKRGNYLRYLRAFPADGCLSLVFLGRCSGGEA